jgi:CRISPR-associated protein Cmx8
MRAMMNNIENITLEFDPFGAMSTQHKAGFAGFMFLSSILLERDEDAPEIIEKDNGTYIIKLTKKAFMNIVKYLYRADRIKIRLKQKKIKKEKLVEPIETIEENNKKIYVYYKHVLKADFIMSDNYKTKWRNGVAQTFGKNAQSICSEGTLEKIFNDNKYLDKQLDVLWEHLAKQSKEKVTANLSIGGAAINNDGQDMFDNNSLFLHFSKICCGFYNLFTIKHNEKGDKGYDIENNGLAVVVPDILNFELFIKKFKRNISEEQDIKSVSDTRDPNLCMPEEAGLEFSLKYLDTELRNVFKKSCCGFDIYHIQIDRKSVV